MSILNRIREQHTQKAQDDAMRAAEAERRVTGPDAGQQAATGRQAYSQQMRAIPDFDVGEELPSPEEQKVHTKLEKGLIELIHSPGQTNKMLKAVFSEQDPLQGIGTVAADIVVKLRRLAPEATDDVLGSIGERAVEEIVELVELADPNIDFQEDDMVEAYSIGLQKYMQGFRHEMDEDELRGFLANG